MKPTKSQRAWCRKKLELWRPRLFLGEWFIDLKYAHEDQDMQAGGRPAADCWSDPVYMQATITVYPCFWNSTPDRREHILVHELAHCLTQSTWNCMKALHMGELITPEMMKCENEQLTQRITNIAFQQEWNK